MPDAWMEVSVSAAVIQAIPGLERQTVLTAKIANSIMIHLRETIIHATRTSGDGREQTMKPRRRNDGA